MGEQPIKGSCLCGKITYEVQGPVKMFQYCMCSRCRKFTGSAHAANIIVPENKFKWLTGEEILGYYPHPEAKHFATGFCKNCGSSLPYKVQNAPVFVVTAGTLDDDPGIKPMHSIFWDSKANWFEETCNLQKFAETPK